jgi:hypothetical protein
MKKIILCAASASLLLPIMVMAQSAFDGTWKTDLSNIKLPEKPDKYLLSNGVYHCETCVPVVMVKADGQDHSVTGHPYYDSVNIKVLDDHTVQEIDKKGGKTVTSSTTKVSADGTKATFEFSDSSNSNAAPVVGKGEIAQVEKGPAGSHAISGSWRTTKVENVSDNGLTTTYALEGSTFKMSAPTGQSYAAPLDGTDSPFTGDPGVTSVSLKRIDKNTIEESDKRAGKVISVARMTVAADGKTMMVAWKDLLHGTSGSYSNVKQ